jgi:phenylpyruvate tautomerase PptA (4-oxalocrotonate tautomerase family)
MTMIAVNVPTGRLSLDQRQRLSETLTDAVMEPEIGQITPLARMGFQVHFSERPTDAMAIGGKLLSAHASVPDVIFVDVVVMDGDWRPEVRRRVIERVFAALADACGVTQAPPGWWVSFRVIEDGSWGARGRPLSALDLLDTGVFTPARAAEIRAALEAKEGRTP